ncbi:MAG: M12 family metallo-peptidase [Bacteroidota bacterium]|nr:M12 family metallo-peptidase [Bacteroidota bacterium]
MINRLLSLTAILILLLPGLQTFAGNSTSAWYPVENNRVALKGEQLIKARQYRSYYLDLNSLKAELKQVTDDIATGKSKETILSLPMSDGTFQDFKITASTVMHPDLGARYPQIKTYNAEGVTDRSAIAKLDVTPFGFHAMILSADGTTYIDPFSLQDPDYYMVYHKRDFYSDQEFVCHTNGSENVIEAERLIAPGTGVAKSIGSELKTYRLALATTGEYTGFFGGTVPGALAAMVTAVNRVTGIYEREFAIRLELIPNTDTLIFTNAATDPYDNYDGGAMLAQNQTTCAARIGGGNYDIGHVFSTGGGGIAGLGVICNFSQKAKGVTGLPTPNGDPFYVDYVAHEMGHQFGGNHTFNSEVGACNGNRSFTSAYEPGSGSTIMAYAGICGSNNLQTFSDDYFHTKSFDEIIIYTTTGIGGACPVVTTTFNDPPVINPGNNYIIPYLTPFRLTGSATDINGDSLTYCWEQHNLGPAGTWNNPSGNAPIFRSFDPSPNPTRLFPKLTNILNNNQTIGEVKPGYARTLSFKLTVRDNRLNGGGVTNNDTPVQVQVINTGQAFAVTSPNTTGIIWQSGGVATVTWDVGSSDVAPINTPLVNIFLSTDGGLTFPILLAQSVANNGSFNVNVPNVFTTLARVMVEGDGNIFFDINDKDFEIGTVGINENEQASGIFVGPNPVNDQFEIIIENPEVLNASGNQLELFDVTGRFITSVPVTQNRLKVSVREWNAGIYLYRFLNDGGMISSGKLIIQE